MDLKEEFKFTIIGHASIYIEFKDIKLLVDPWFLGSCYWRSWWNYPTIDKNIIDNLKPTHIYITHLHWDHYHGPSLRYLEKFNPTVIFPKACTKRMFEDCKKFFKFKNVIEIDHAKKFAISKDFNLTHYQFGPPYIDSAVVIQTKKNCILNANDTKIFGLSLKQIISNHKKFDFVFRSHSSASPFPHCLRGNKKVIAERNSFDYAKEFTYFANATKAKYAIPFASSHCYLRKESKIYNKFYSNPEFVKNTHSNITKPYQECVVMPSGSSWSSVNGFTLSNHDYKNIEVNINNLEIKYSKYLESQYEKEKRTKLNIKKTEEYFQKFFKANLWPLKISFNFGWLLFEESTKFYYLVKYEKNRFSIKKSKSLTNLNTNNLSFFVELPTLVFNDCVVKYMFNTFTPSKLLTIHIKNKRSIKNINHLFFLLDLYENDGLPWPKIFQKRQFINRISRWREILDLATFYIKIILIKKPISSLYKTKNI